MLILRLIRESYLFAFQAIIVNKVRTILSLSGITIGIFCIISVFTIFDSMEIAIRENIDSLGSNVLFVQKWPWSMGGEYPWWKYYQRPEASLDDMREIGKRSTLSEVSAFMISVTKTVKFQGNYMEGIEISGVSHDFDKVLPFEISDGRYFSPLESSSGKNVSIIGNEIALNLFPGMEPVGRRIKVMGRNVGVIGVINKEGEDMFGNSNDNAVLLPINYFKSLVNIRDMGAAILVRAKPLVSNDELRDELTGIMRSVRKLKPAADDNFAINETSIITEGFESFFNSVAIIGWIIGGFSLLVGGFGIANIMFVSVKERTGIIGIQKAIGAKNYFILLQFLFEAIFLSLIGGIVGLLLVYILTLVITYGFEFPLILTAGNIWLGTSVAGVIGLVSGIIPASRASRLDPVDAMRSTG
ncbi:MAG: ABC transporter permease [Bacteroidia bacterium]|nr:ABC transporter permease [Bacteroidia bacterium]